MYVEVLSEYKKNPIKQTDNKYAEQCITTVMYAAYDDIRTRLYTLLGFNSRGGGSADGKDSASIVLFPSGSDAEFLPLVVALIRANKGGGKIPIDSSSSIVY